jgi:hypothetical protein
MEILQQLHEAVHRKWPELWHNNAPAHKTHFLSLCEAVSGTEIDYWKGTPTLFPSFSSEWLLAVSKNEVWLKGMKISVYWRHPKNLMMSSRNVSNSDSIIGLSA